MQTGTERARTYSVPAEVARDFTPEQFSAFVFGRQSDAHVRRWYAEQRLRAMDGITTDSLLEALRGPKPAIEAIKAKCQALRDEAVNNPNFTTLDYVNICRFADKQEAREISEVRSAYREGAL